MDLNKQQKINEEIAKILGWTPPSRILPKGRWTHVSPQNKPRKEEIWVNEGTGQEVVYEEFLDSFYWKNHLGIHMDLPNFYADKRYKEDIINKMVKIGYFIDINETYYDGGYDVSIKIRWNDTKKIEIDSYSLMEALCIAVLDVFQINWRDG